MSQATVIAIAEAVKDLINGVVFSMPFTATRTYVPRFKLEELTELQVTVVPNAIESAFSTRTQTLGPWQIDVGFHCKVAAGEGQAAQVDALMQLVEEVGDWITDNALPDALRAKWLRNANDPLFDHAHLKEKNVFVSLLTVTYQVTRTIARS